MRDLPPATAPPGMPILHGFLYSYWSGDYGRVTIYLALKGA